MFEEIFLTVIVDVPDGKQGSFPCGFAVLFPVTVKLCASTILTWKKNKQSEQADEVVIQNSFVFRVANSLKKDQERNIRRNQFEASQISFEENQELLEDNEHQEIFTSLAELGEDNFRTLEDALSYCENDLERDALLSLSNGEKAKAFAERHNIETDNANQIRRRTKEKVKSRVRALNQNIDEVEENHG